MKSVRNHKSDSKKSCKKLQTNTVNDIESISKDTSNVIKKFQKKKKYHQATLHWSTYKFEPTDRLGRLRRFKNNCSSQDLRNLIVNNKNNKLSPPFHNSIPHLSYCLLCGSPGHIVDQCNPNYKHLKYLNDAKEDDASRSTFKDSRQWSTYVTTLPMLLLSTSNVDANNGINLNSCTSKKQLDTSLHRVALPLVESDSKTNCRGKVDKITEKNKAIFQSNSWAKVEKRKCGLPFGPTHQSFKTKGFDCSNKYLSKTNAQQGAQMRFQEKVGHKSNNLAVVEETNKCRTQKYSLSSSSKTSPCRSGCSSNSNSDESSVAVIFGTLNGVPTNMLLDTGSSISAITETFAQHLKLETWSTRDTLVVTLANTHIERYPERTCLVTLKIGDLDTYEELTVLPDQIYNVTLGKSWLKRHKVICDYGRDLLQLPNSRPVQIGFPPALELLSQKDVVKSDGNHKNKSSQKTSCRFLRF